MAHQPLVQNPSAMINTLVSNINRRRGLPSSIIDTLSAEFDELIRANEEAQGMYDTTTVDGLQRLLSAERQNLSNAIREINVGVRGRLQMMNEHLGEYFEDLRGIYNPVLDLEAKISTYEIDLANFEYKNNCLKQEFNDYKEATETGSVVPAPIVVNDDDPIPNEQPNLTHGEINKRNNQFLYFICGRIKYSQTVTANSFNNLLKIIVTDTQNCSEGTIWSWRKRAMDAYAWRTATVGLYRNDFNEKDFIDIMRAIRMLVKNNSFGANEVPDKLP